MANWLNPGTSTQYATLIAELKDRDLDVAKGLDPAVVTVSNPVAGMIRWTSAGSKWQKYSGTTWVDLSDQFAIPIVGGSINNSPIGSTTRSTGKFTTIEGTTSIQTGLSTGLNILMTTSSITARNNGATATLTFGPASFGGNSLQSPALRNYREVVVTANSTAAYAVDCALANVFVVTLTADCTFSFTNVPPNVAFSVTMKLIQDATGSRDATWPATVKAPSGVLPVLTTTPNKGDYVSLTTYNGGASWDLFPGAKNF